MIRRPTLSLALSALFFCAISLQAAPGPEILARPAEWATAVPGTSVGNLYRIEDGLYRAAQPTAAGFTDLSKLGVTRSSTLREAPATAPSSPATRSGSSTSR